MNVKYCNNLFNCLPTGARLEAISLIMDTLKSKELEMVLVIIESHLDNVDLRSIKVTEKNSRGVNEKIKKNPKDETKNSSNKSKDSFLYYLEANVAEKVPEKKEKTKLSYDLLPKQCSICNKSFRGKFDLNRHIRCHTKEKPFMCIICQKTFSQRSNGNTHVKLRHPLNLEKYENVIIKKPPNTESFVSQSEPIEKILSIKNKGDDDSEHITQQPTKQHNNIEKDLLDCNEKNIPIPKRKVGRPIKLNKTLKECSYCEKKFEHNWNLERHLKRHCNVDEKVLKCSFCEKTFDQKWFLKCHESRHVNIIKRVRPSNLRSLSPNKGNSNFVENDIDMDEGNNPEEQPITKEQSIEGPMNNVRSFECNLCNKSLKTMQGLKKHVLIHQGTLLHSCDFCEKRFRRADHLLNHRRGHTGEKPFKCDKCGWSGPTSSSFSVHKKRHMNK